MKYLLILTLIFSTIISDDDYDDHHEYKEYSYNKDLRYLKLDSEQKKIAKQILKKYRKDIKKYRKKRKKLEKQKQNEFLEVSFNKNNITKINEKIISYSTKIESDFLEDLHDLLTPNQRRKFVKHMDEWEIE